MLMTTFLVGFMSWSSWLEMSKIDLYAKLHEPRRQDRLCISPLRTVARVQRQHGAGVQDVECIERGLHAGPPCSECSRQPYVQLVVAPLREIAVRLNQLDRSRARAGRTTCACPDIAAKRWKNL